MNEFLGPLGWRPTSTESEDLSATRASAPTRNSIFASAPKTEKSSPSPAVSSGVSASRWLPLPHPNPWSQTSNSVKHYQMKVQHQVQVQQVHDWYKFTPGAGAGAGANYMCTIYAVHSTYSIMYRCVQNDWPSV